MHCLIFILFIDQAKYDLEDEAKIHRVIRQNHPNLLGAMAILEFDKPRRVMKNKVEDIYGYVFMERAGMANLVFDL